MTKNIFFLGKGGVGKSTSSALTALHLAEQGYKVLLSSLDPAHNLNDIFETSFTNNPKKTHDNLRVQEIDIDVWVKKYLKDMQFQVKRTYSYLTAFNLEKYLDIMQYSPGIEEYALLMAYKQIRETNLDKDYLIFDMPPTALTVKFLGLPQLSLTWLENLLDLRLKIMQKRQIVHKIKFGNKDIETDKVTKKLQEQIASYTAVKEVFENPEITYLNLVMNTDKLSFSESELIVKKLKDFDISIKNIFLNKYQNNFDLTPIKQKYPNCQIQIFPYHQQALLGKDTLLNYLKQLPGFITL